MIYLLIIPNFWIYLVLLAFYFVGCVSNSVFLFLFHFDLFKILLLVFVILSVSVTFLFRIIFLIMNHHNE